MFSTIRLEDYFEFYSADDIRIKGHRIGIEDVLKYYRSGYTLEEIKIDLPFFRSGYLISFRRRAIAFRGKVIYKSALSFTKEIIALAKTSNVFDFLNDEPELYSLEDGEAV